MTKQHKDIFRSAILALLLGVMGTTMLFAQNQTRTLADISFTVNANGDKVLFSPGNLQYRASTNTWRFAINPWDYVGDENSNISSTYNGWIDLFGWGTSGYNHGGTAYQPWSTSTNNSDYYAYGNNSYNLYDQTGQADWGYNAVANGSNTENCGWRTLTHAEWNYVFNTRSTSSGIRYAKANVNGINGIILLPDEWNTTFYSLNSTNTAGVNYNINTLNFTQWAAIEQHGAVFLPAAGYRYGTSVNDVGSGGYWSASYSGSDGAYYVYFGGGYLNAGYGSYRLCGQSVRLVRTVENYSFGINASPSPAEGGAVSGAGAYSAGAVCTLTATPSVGYDFVWWSEEGCVVSTDAAYTFTVLRDRNMVANFVVADNLVFADANVKALCVANWDNNGDGELSYAEAAQVTNIGEVFKNNTTISSFNELQFFINLNTIGDQAFYGCTLLTQITIPESVVTIGSKAFWNCPALQTVTFNAINCVSMQTAYNSNTYSVFSSDASGSASALTRVVVGNSVTRIPDYAFKGSVDIYQRLVVPASVVRIGKYAFYNCNSLVQMVIQGNGLQTIDEYAFWGCSALRSALNLPNSVTTLGQYAFYGCLVLPSATFGTGVETIGGYAFWNCPALTTVNFNATNCTSMVTNSQYSVFNSGTGNGGATPMTTLSIGNTVTRIPDFAFRNSPSITHAITIPNAITYIGQYAFYGIQSAELTIGTGITEIGGYAFWNCSNLATVHFNATNCTTMKTGQYSVFNSGTNNGGATPIVTLNIGSNVTNIPDYAFRNSSNATGGLLLPNGLTNIGQYAFAGSTSFTGNLTIPNAVNSIGQYAFYDCSGFNGSLTLPVNESLTIINEYTFAGCSSLTGTLTIPANVTEVAHSAFRNCSSFTGVLVLHNAMTTIGQYAFYGCSNISELTIGESINTIDGYAFWNCSNLITVHFNATNCTSMVTNSQYSVFNSNGNNGNASSIVTLTIGENVTKIPAYAFRYSSNMICDIIIPDAVTSIGTYAFANCSGHNVFTGNNVTSIPTRAFNSSSGFTGTLILGNAVTNIGEAAFEGCSSFKGDLVIPNAVTTLGSYAFRNCSGFDGSLVIGSGVQTINQYTFANCSGFQGSLIIGRQVNSIGNYAFQNCSGFTTLISENPTPPTAVNNSFQNMNYSIPAYVPYAMVPAYQSAVGWNQFNNYKEQCVFDQLDNDLWSDENNWYAFELPGPNDVVCVNSNCHLDVDAEVLHIYVLNLNDALTVNNGQTLNTTYGIGILQASQLVMEDGSQLINNLPGLYGTMQRQINGYGNGAGGWYTIAAPIYGGMPVSSLATDNYDLYAYDEPYAIWTNHKDEATVIQSFAPGQGLLYANQNGISILFEGQLNASNADISVPVTCQNGILPGFNLLGNPYTNNINIRSVKFNNSPITTYFKVVNGSQLLTYTDAEEDAIQPTEGFFVQVPADGTVYFNSPSNRDKSSYVRLILSKDDKMLDRTYLRMNEGTPMNKAFVDGHPSLLYLIANHQSYAVANHDAQAYNLCFEPMECGTFVIESSLLGVDCQYLHLIDRFTGVDTDLLQTSQYTFEADTTDDINRFALLLAPDAMLDGEMGICSSHSAVPALPSHGGSSGQVSYDDSLIYVTVRSNPTAGGTVTGANIYSLGDAVTVTATANEGYYFVNWTENGVVVSTNAIYNFTVTNSRALVANFNPVSYMITAMSNPADGGVVTGAGTYINGTVCTLTAIANTGYLFQCWMKPNGVVVSDTPAYSFEVTEAATYIAQFNEVIGSGTATDETLPSHSYYNYTLSQQIYTADEIGSLNLINSVSFYNNGTTKTRNYSVYMVNTDKFVFNSSSDWIMVTAADQVFSGNVTMTAGEWTTITLTNPFATNGTNLALIVDDNTGSYSSGMTCRVFNANGNQTLRIYSDGMDYNPYSPASYSGTLMSVKNQIVLGGLSTSSTTHTQSFTEGWNWWSTYVELNGNDGLEQLESSLGADGLVIKSRNDGYVEPFEYNGTLTWYGTLNAICNEQFYKINTTSACAASVTGQPTVPANHPVTLCNGWNWIGFPVQQGVSVSTALSGLVPEPNDIIKGRNGYASYYSADGYSGWYGTINTLEPGQGYMYKSNSNSLKTFTFAMNRGEIPQANITPEHNYNKPRTLDFADNMTLTAVIEMDGTELSDDTYELAAFVGDECRGSVKLIRVEAVNRYIAFLTVFGLQGEELTFRLTDGAKTVTAMEKTSFSIDCTVGSLSSPFILHFCNLDVYDALVKPVLVYPNPSNGVFVVECQGVKRIEVYNTFGQCLYSEKGDDSILHINLQDYADGVYLLRVITDDGVSNHSIVKK